MRPVALEIRGPVPPAEGGTERPSFEWRIVDIVSREVIFSGASTSNELALEEARAVAEQVMHRGLICSLPGDLDAQRDAERDTPSRRKGLAHSLKEDLHVLRAAVRRKPHAQPGPTGSVPPAARPAEPRPAKPKHVPKPSGSRPPPLEPAATPQAPRQSVGQTPALPPTRASGPMALVHSLLSVVDSLPSTEQVAIDLLDQVRVEVPADGAAVLLREGDGWRVAAGDGLRPLEFRCVLADDHWLVAGVYRDGHPVLLDNTDAGRAQLAGAPLASRRSLMVVPLVGANALLLLARQGDPPFARKEVARAAKLSQATVQVLVEAVDVRELARSLARYQESSPPVAPPAGT